MKLKNFFIKIAQVVLLLFGISTIAYPFFSRVYKNNLEKEEIKQFYENTLSENNFQRIKDEKQKIEEEIEKEGFNSAGSDGFNTTEKTTSEYELPEPVGVITIPKINSVSTIYPSIDDYVLDKAIGVLPRTNLPYGGINTNSVLIGHRGTHNADLFRYLDELEMGDLILIDNKLSEYTLAYRVISQEIVEPDQGDKIKKIEGKDIITLVTCAPYLINSHRILITAERDLSYTKEKTLISTMELQKPEMKKVIKRTAKSEYTIGVFLIIFFFAVVLLIKIWRKRKWQQKTKKE